MFESPARRSFFLIHKYPSSLPLNPRSRSARSLHSASNPPRFIGRSLSSKEISFVREYTLILSTNRFSQDLETSLLNVFADTRFVPRYRRTIVFHVFRNDLFVIGRPVVSRRRERPVNLRRFWIRRRSGDPYQALTLSLPLRSLLIRGWAASGGWRVWTRHGHSQRTRNRQIRRHQWRTVSL